MDLIAFLSALVAQDATQVAAVAVVVAGLVTGAIRLVNAQWPLTPGEQQIAGLAGGLVVPLGAYAALTAVKGEAFTLNGWFLAVSVAVAVISGTLLIQNRESKGQGQSQGQPPVSQ